MATHFSVSQPCVSEWEAGIRIPVRATLERLNGLGKTKDQLLLRKAASRTAADIAVVLHENSIAPSKDGRQACYADSTGGTSSYGLSDNLSSVPESRQIGASDHSLNAGRQPKRGNL